jgi:hypothetical protein
MGYTDGGRSLPLFRQNRIRLLAELPVLFLSPLFRQFTELRKPPRPVWRERSDGSEALQFYRGIGALAKVHWTCYLVWIVCLLKLDSV